MASGHAREESIDAEAARTGRRRHPRHRRSTMTVDTGAYPGMGGMIGGLIEQMLPGPYKIGAARVHVHRRPSPTRPRTSPTAGRGPPRCSRASDDRHRRQAARHRAARDAAAQRRHARRGAAARWSPAAASPASRPASRSSAWPRSSTSRRSARGRRRRGPRAATSASASPRYIEAAPGPERGRRRRHHGRREHAHAARAPTAPCSVFTGADAARAGPRDDVRPDRGRRDRRAVRAGAGRRRRQRHVAVRASTGGSRAATMAGGATLHTARALSEQILDVVGRPARGQPRRPRDRRRQGRRCGASR